MQKHIVNITVDLQGEQETHKPFVEGSTPSLATSDLDNLTMTDKVFSYQGSAVSDVCETVLTEMPEQSGFFLLFFFDDLKQIFELTIQCSHDLSDCLQIWIVSFI